MALVERESPTAGIALLRLNRPERLNAISAELMTELMNHLDQIARDTSCRAIILTGTGRGFCAGADIKAGAFEKPHDVVSTWERQHLYSDVVLKMRQIPQPIIAAVNGPAVGGGLALTLGADIRLAATSARFSAAFIQIGLSGCDMGTSWHLARLVGIGAAHEMMLTGRIIDSAEALRIGLVLEVLPEDQLMKKALEKAELIKSRAPLGVMMTKEVMWSTVEIPSLRAAIDLENRTQVLLSRTEDQPEAVAAFIAKRPPQFKRR